MADSSIKTIPGILVAEERVTPSLIDELSVLFDEHWKELALYRDEIRLDPNYEMYLQMDAVGLLAPYIVRHEAEGWIVGYAVYFIRPHPHYKNHIWAAADLFWIHPDHRNAGVGNALFAFVEKDLASRGCHVMHTATKASHPAAGFLLTARGHDKTEISYSKRLG